MRDLPINQLRTLICINETGSFSAAASRLCKTQSAITHQMQNLELLVGQPLFYKQGRHRVLTRDGEQLLQHAHRIIAINDRALMSPTLDRAEGVLRIGAPYDVAEIILPSILSHIQRVLPQATIEVSIERSPVLLEQIHASKIDLVIAPRFDQRLEGAILRTSATAWICASNYVYDSSLPLSLILADGTSLYREMALNSLARARIPWHAKHIAHDLAGIKAAVRAGLGVTPRTIEILTPELRTLGKSNGLPDLPEITYYFWMSPYAGLPLVRHAFDIVVQNWGLTEISPA